jgi:hypothetical protein
MVQTKKRSVNPLIALFLQTVSVRDEKEEVAGLMSPTPDSRLKTPD